MKRRIIDLAEVSELKRQYKSEQLQVLRCMEQKTADSNRIIVLMEEIISLVRTFLVFNYGIVDYLMNTLYLRNAF